MSENSICITPELELNLHASEKVQTERECIATIDQSWMEGRRFGERRDTQ